MKASLPPCLPGSVSGPQKTSWAKTNSRNSRRAENPRLNPDVLNCFTLFLLFTVSHNECTFCRLKNKTSDNLYRFVVNYNPENVKHIWSRCYLKLVLYHFKNKLSWHLSPIYVSDTLFESIPKLFFFEQMKQNADSTFQSFPDPEK